MSLRAQLASPQEKRKNGAEASETRENPKDGNVPRGVFGASTGNVIDPSGHAVRGRQAEVLDRDDQAEENHDDIRNAIHAVQEPNLVSEKWSCSRRTSAT